MSPIRLGRSKEPQPPGAPGTPQQDGVDSNEVRTETSDLRGYAIETGIRAKIKPKKAKDGESQGVSPVILFAAIGALVLLILALVARPGGSAGNSTEDNKALIASYQTYLNQKKPARVDVKARLEEVQQRLDAIAWAERVGRQDVMRRELDMLLMLDADRASPVYVYASRRLSRMPAG